VREQVRLAVASHRPIEIPLGEMRDSAVLVLLHEERGVEHLVLQVRSRRMALHRGEIGFPGGTRDAADHSLLATALRETREEIGLPEHEIEVYGQLDDAVTVVSNYRVRPYAAAVRPGARDFVADTREVHALLRVPLEHLLSPAAQGWYVVERDGQPVPTAAYHYGEHVIWGATARMIAQFLSLIGGPAAEVPR
jgi:8-oxo-dGTP pyrophosphatase MutT (NUDIX family)